MFIEEAYGGYDSDIFDSPNDNAGCSVSSGQFNGSFTCTPSDLNAATIEQRQSWFNDMLYHQNSSLVQEFVNINTILNVFIATDTGTPGTWASWGDAGILNSIQNGLALSVNATPAIGQSPYADQAANAWFQYFQSFMETGSSNETLQNWGKAEGAGTTYGKLLAQEHGQKKSTGEMLFLAIGDKYRSALKARQDPSTMKGPRWSADLYGWFLDTSSTIPYTNASPVGLVAYPLLQWK